MLRATLLAACLLSWPCLGCQGGGLAGYLPPPDGLPPPPPAPTELVAPSGVEVIPAEPSGPAGEPGPGQPPIEAQPRSPAASATEPRSSPEPVSGGPDDAGIIPDPFAFLRADEAARRRAAEAGSQAEPGSAIDGEPGDRAATSQEGNDAEQDEVLSDDLERRKQLRFETPEPRPDPEGAGADEAVLPAGEGRDQSDAVDRTALSRMARAVLAPVTTRTEAGVYGEDERWFPLAHRFDDVTQSVLGDMAERAGIGFKGGLAPEVVLMPLRDESQAHRIRTQVEAGRRRLRIEVNVEPIVARRRSLSQALGAALVAARFEETRLRHGAVPAWVIQLGAAVCDADLGGQLRDLQRRRALGLDTGGLIDVDDPRRAETTALAIWLLMRKEGRDGEIPRVLAFAAEGDDPLTGVQRALRLPDDQWRGPARRALEVALETLDAPNWSLLTELERERASAGRSGLLAALPDPLPPAVEPEVQVLLAEAAVAEGDWDAARPLLRFLDADALGSIRDPAGALALGVEVESRAGGDQHLAGRWLARLERDYPKSTALARLRDEQPLLGCGVDPAGWLARMGRRIEERGFAGLGLPVLERYLRALLIDHRAGAARRLLEQLAERGQAPELAQVREAVNEAERFPSEAALEVGRRRLARWQLRPRPEHARDVRAGGHASFAALIEALPQALPRQRAALVRFLVETGGVRKATLFLARSWQGSKRVRNADLESIMVAASYAELADDLPAALEEALGHRWAAGLWRDLCLALPGDWLRAHPTFLTRVRDPVFRVRMAAVEEALVDAPLTPELIGRFMRDPSPLVREQAMVGAERMGFASLAQQGLRDPAARVRRRATAAVAEISGADAALSLSERLRVEPDAEVRAVTVAATVRLEPRDRVILDAAVERLADPSPVVRDAAAGALVEAGGLPVADAVERALRQERRRQPMRGDLVVRQIAVFQRIAGFDVGFVPGEVASLDRALGRVRIWVVGARRDLARDDRTGAPR